jgi:hypothetical protein
MGQVMTKPVIAGISLKLLVLKTSQLDKLVAFYQALGIGFVQEQHGKGRSITPDRWVERS